MDDRVTYDSNGDLDEIVGSKGAHLESLGNNYWFLCFEHDDGTSTAVWFKSKDLNRPTIEEREPPFDARQAADVILQGDAKHRPTRSQVIEQGE